MRNQRSSPDVSRATTHRGSAAHFRRQSVSGTSQKSMYGVGLPDTALCSGAMSQAPKGVVRFFDPGATQVIAAARAAAVIGGIEGGAVGGRAGPGDGISGGGVGGIKALDTFVLGSACKQQPVQSHPSRKLERAHVNSGSTAPQSELPGPQGFEQAELVTVGGIVGFCAKSCETTAALACVDRACRQHPVQEHCNICSMPHVMLA
eukprot:6173735-Pleurochrysis_carterae.AAC.2